MSNRMNLLPCGRFIKIMKNISCILLTVLSVFSQQLYAQKNITLEDIWTKGTFSAKGVPGFNSMNDGRYYCAQDNNENIIRYAFATGNAVDTLVKAADLVIDGKSIKNFSYTWSKDESKLLIQTDIKPIFRHSFSSMVYVYDLKTKVMFKPSTEPVRLPDLSPDGGKIAYVKGNDLFYTDIKAEQEWRITANGKKNSIINGATDWVYEEEFALVKGFYWNASGDGIVYYEFDESGVPEYSMPTYGKLYPENETFKYPKAGEANSVIRILSYKIGGNSSVSMDIGAEKDIYIPRVYWTLNNKIFIERLNRLQNKIEFLLADPSTGKSSVIYTETNKAYIEVPEISFLADGKSFVFKSEKNGWDHLYMYDLSGKEIKQLTSGNWDVDQFYGLNEKTGLFYYSSGEENSTERYIYSASYKGKQKTKLTPQKGWNTASFNSDFSYFMNAVSDINTPSRYALCNGTGKEVRLLEENKILKDKLPEYNLTKAEMTEFTNAYGEKLNAFVIKPINFNENNKYPVLMYVYGGPGHQLAVNRWMGGNYFWYQMLSQKGYMIVCVDGRGTGFKGENFKKVTYLQLGKFEIEDQIEIAKQLGKKLYVDATRIGIWGWSFGGYMASLGISKGADVFKTAIAVAPVTNWRYYDNIYTERFMRTPKENGDNYDSNSPINHVEKIKGKFLIIHGTADDNVHFQNSVEMVNSMINKGVKFDSEFYPNKNHGIGGAKTRLHLYDRMTRFILENL